MESRFVVEMPAWVGPFVRAAPEGFVSPVDRMRLAVDLARENVRRGTGGPFGAAVFEERSGRLVSVGVNRVVASGLSLAHAEMVALALAQRTQGVYALGDAGAPHQLVTSCEPCAMCFGAIPWAGVASVLCGARSEDAVEVGFDEGAKPRAWREALVRRGVRVEVDCLRDEAVSVLREYVARGGTIYG